MAVCAGNLSQILQCSSPRSSAIRILNSATLTRTSKRIYTCSSHRIKNNEVTIQDILKNALQEEEKECKKPLDSDLCEFQRRVSRCNRGKDRKSEFLPFILEKKIVGYVHSTIVERLKFFQDMFVLGNNASETSQPSATVGSFLDFITLADSLKTPDERTEAVGVAVKALHKEGLIKGLRNEFYPVVQTFGTNVLFSLERAAVPYFGTKAYGIHMNGYVKLDSCGEKQLWIAKRSVHKETFPGMLDHLVAGGLPIGMSCKENVIKECGEEAGIPRTVAERAIPVGVVSYEDITGIRIKRDVLFCYDLLLPRNFLPVNTDGEVESFMLVPITEVAAVINQTEVFKPNCAVVIIDFLFRHGYLNPNQPGYLSLLRSLRNGECS